MIPLTRNEIASLLASLITRSGHRTGHRLRWSAWRRHHQHTRDVGKGMSRRGIRRSPKR
jgi:hypothetical protein